MRESVIESPGTSIRRRGKELQISRSSLQRILTADLRLHAYKVQLTQELKPNDHAQRRAFVEWIIEHQQVDADFSSKIILSDEAHFHLDGFVNRQNCRIWGSENPHVTVEKKCIHNVSLFGADFGLEASLDHTSLKMRLVKQ